ncbi:DNA repair protein RecO [Halothiobacillus diazotrophicus]|uniref:DNA repair protein RecO n=1 Tax=Halothiobacillus diazotrophicus TaxID=1860122 RepID=A0A191ZG78_9GAMM|nr:DNA repair protein RecO [Halothiobacillus diazotrophicus]ANJ66873.1 DNA repair protein RecO [Halothiobacillus diazotrophicus]
MTRAYVLHTRPWRETSLLVDWFTEDHGRLMTRQRGARQSGRKSTGRPLPFQGVQMVLAGRGDMKTATQIDLTEPPRILSGQSLAVGFYFNELLMRTLERQEPMPGLFCRYGEALAQLSCQALQLGIVIRGFERDLLDELGFGIDWTHTADLAETLEADATYWVDAEVGILSRPAPGGLSLPGRVLQAIAGDKLPDSNSDQRLARDLMQYLLRPHVGSAPFRSRELWQSVPSPDRAIADS